jgi:hypothetical protein
MDPLTPTLLLLETFLLRLLFLFVSYQSLVAPQLQIPLTLVDCSL